MKHWRGQPDHDYWRKPFTPRERANAWWGLAAVFGVLALMDYLQPRQPPFTGRWAWVQSWAFDWFGTSGSVGVFVGIAFLLALAGLANYRKAA